MVERESGFRGLPVRLFEVRGWRDWISALFLRRIKEPKSLLAVVLKKPVSPRLKRSVLHWADRVGEAGETLTGAGLKGNALEKLERLSREPGPEELEEFKTRCLERWRKSVLWISPEVLLKNPSMKAMVQSAPFLLKEGWTLRLWCQKAGLEDPKVQIEKFWRPAYPWLLAWLIFPWQVLFRQFCQWLVVGRPPARLVHTCINGYLKPDFYTVHFLNGSWSRAEWRRKGWRALSLRLLIAWYIAAEDIVFLRWWRPRRLIAVGKAEGEALQQKAGVRKSEIALLPTAYDPEEFNPERRATCKELARKNWGFAEQHCVLAFACQGGYERKGLFLLGEALERLWKRGERSFRVLLFGGKGQSVEKMKKRMLELFPSSGEWLIVAGWVESLSEAMSGADAFVFPSYFEAFSAVEAEACGLGLPLALTPHWGTEMVLKPGINGMELPWDGETMAERLLEFRAKLPDFVPLPPEATPIKEYPARLLELYTSAKEAPACF